MKIKEALIEPFKYMYENSKEGIIAILVVLGILTITGIPSIAMIIYFMYFFSPDLNSQVVLIVALIQVVWLFYFWRVLENLSN